MKKRKRSPNDATMRNITALKKRVKALEAEVNNLWKAWAIEEILKTQRRAVSARGRRK